MLGVKRSPSIDKPPDNQETWKSLSLSRVKEGDEFTYKAKIFLQIFSLFLLGKGMIIIILSSFGLFF
jgi:hypothetical protein